ncbi:MAG: hypothetical protein LBS49_04095, partial [Candidatus Accumulibacter sp.]|nr:hypothetical protein [Accumulibacter sp.]
MLAINPYTANSWGSASPLAGVAASGAVENDGKTAAGNTDSSASVSNLARQLSEAAARAAARDASMTMPQLAME